MKASSPGRLQVTPLDSTADRAAWDDLATRSTVGHRHQCLWWMAPLQRYGFRIDVLGSWNEGVLVGGGLFRSYDVPLIGGTITECLDGPIFKEWRGEWADDFMAGISELAGRAKSMAVLIRDCPHAEVHHDLIVAFRRAGLGTQLHKGPSDAVLTLEGRTIEQIRSGFNRGSRSRVKRGQKDVTIRQLCGAEDLTKAYAAWMATAARKSFTDVRPWLGLEPVLRHCIDNGLGMVLGSFLQERLLAASFITFVGTTASWVYGGYMDDAEQHNPTHVLQFEAIQESLTRGFPRYNFGYLLAENQPGARGVDEFKLGFGAVPQRHHDTIVWKRRPLAYAAIEWLRRGSIGRSLEAVLKRQLIGRGDAQGA
jgi:GNAT acetyltransferase-like protein